MDVTGLQSEKDKDLYIGLDFSTQQVNICFSNGRFLKHSFSLFSLKRLWLIETSVCCMIPLLILMLTFLNLGKCEFRSNVLSFQSQAQLSLVFCFLK